MNTKNVWKSRGIHPIPARFDEYDLVFAIGALCAISHILNSFKLRTFANPFEWIEGIIENPDNGLEDSRFIEKISALCNNFDDYFNIEDFDCRLSNDVPEHLPVFNNRYKIGWWHLFSSSQSWQRSFPDARDKIMRRGNRLIEKISASDHVLIVWAERVLFQRNYPVSPVSDADIINAVKMLNHKWPHKKFDLVFFEHDGTKEKFDFDKIKVCDGAYRIKSNHFDLGTEYIIKQASKFKRSDIPLVLSEMFDNIKLRKE